MSSDSRFFSTTKKGEIHELRKELDSTKDSIKREAVKKVIAAMTVGKDVSTLFPDVVKCIRTSNLELKKLVYLYVMNYAKSQPDLAILCVNAFVQDSMHPNPLVRGLAVRTMGCIRVDRITEYLMQPLRECLRDKDPYVRKTAAICVAKVWDINPELVDSQGFLEVLRDLLTDANPMVVANAVSALTEINATHDGGPVFEVGPHNLSKLLAALSECTEWGQVFILEALARYAPREAGEAEMVCERVAPRLAHANAAVVLAAVRCLMSVLDHASVDVVRAYAGKMAPPLVTLMSRSHEIQYVGLRAMALVCAKRPQVLAHEMRVFFVKYNDPIYVKLEKLELMCALVSERTVDGVLAELVEYAQEVDAEFVRRAVRAIGRCALKLEAASERCVLALVDLCATRVSYVVQESVCVMRDVFRRYGARYEGVIATLCEALDTLDDPRAKAALIWIVGQFARHIANADALLESFLASFGEEQSAVQLALLTAVTKVFLAAHDQDSRDRAQRQLTRVLELCTTASSHPDVRDRGFVYWRLLAADPALARAALTAAADAGVEETQRLDPALVEALCGDLAALSAVYHRPPEMFMSRWREKVHVFDPQRAQEEAGMRQHDAPPPQQQQQQQKTQKEDLTQGGLLLDLGDFDSSPSSSSSSSSSSAGATASTSGSSGGGGAAAAAGGGGGDGMELWLAEGDGQGLEVRGCVESDLSLRLSLSLRASASRGISSMLVQLKRNIGGLKPAVQSLQVVVRPGQRGVPLSVPLTREGGALAAVEDPEEVRTLQIAAKTELGVHFMKCPMPLVALFGGQGRLDKAAFLKEWKAMPDRLEKTVQVPKAPAVHAARVVAELGKAEMYEVARRETAEATVVYMSSRLSGLDQQWVLTEITVFDQACSIAFKTTAEDLTNVLALAFQKFFSKIF